MSNPLSELQKIWRMRNYKKQVASIALQLCWSIVFSQNSFIIWSEHYRLSPADYQGQIDFNSTHSASTSYSVSNRWEWLSDSTLQVEIVCRFFPQNSWMKANPTEQLIQHEQTHFDLAEVYARRIRQQLQWVHLTAQDCDEKVHQIVQEMRAACMARQRDYDAETAHGTRFLEQRAWNERILLELAALQAYQNTQWVLKIKQP